MPARAASAPLPSRSSRTSAAARRTAASFESSASSDHDEGSRDAAVAGAPAAAPAAAARSVSSFPSRSRPAWSARSARGTCPPRPRSATRARPWGRRGGVRGRHGLRGREWVAKGSEGDETAFVKTNCVLWTGDRSQKHDRWSKTKRRAHCARARLDRAVRGGERRRTVPPKSEKSRCASRGDRGRVPRAGGPLRRRGERGRDAQEARGARASEPFERRTRSRLVRAEG